MRQSNTMGGLALTAMLSLIIMSVTGCSTHLSREEWKTQVEAKIDEWQLQPVDNITTFRLDSWASLGEWHLMVRTSPFKAYLLALGSRCPDLTYSQSLLLKQQLSTSLMAKFDSVATVDTPVPQCRIERIYPLTREQDKALRALDSGS
ncbi:DUF6491 family protein [Shewanella sedimentimangrovi]|uniref:Lipoprotein n=1 Tax=Shewanella sedimentimangrovi TaxID=2814293 RepID=A0ABX7R0B7_9GAMM|nr:DUF6491 family protein [Shewanella sedimentimangrovi]QSX37232.1 hypothetical protein JYB85_18650 [Shewanella sedimentimangrovi]